GGRRLPAAGLQGDRGAGGYRGAARGRAQPPADRAQRGASAGPRRAAPPRLLNGEPATRPPPAAGAAPRCPVCGAAPARFLCRVAQRDYGRCPVCAATFLDPAQLPDSATELAHYRLHRNDPRDPGYRGFLARLAEPLRARLAPGACGLDYGCGPGP